MTKIFEILGIIAWVLCFTKEILFTIKNTNLKESYLKDFKNKAFEIIRLDKLLLIIIFIYYVNFNKQFVTSLLFTVICLYFFINKFYEKSKKEKNINIMKKHWLVITISYVIALLPFVYLMITRNYEITSIILLFFIFFSYFIVGIANYITRILKNKR